MRHKPLLNTRRARKAKHVLQVGLVALLLCTAQVSSSWAGHKRAPMPSAPVRVDVLAVDRHTPLLLMESAESPLSVMQAHFLVDTQPQQALRAVQQKLQKALPRTLRKQVRLSLQALPHSADHTRWVVTASTTNAKPTLAMGALMRVLHRRHAPHMLQVRPHQLVLLSSKTLPVRQRQRLQAQLAKWGRRRPLPTSSPAAQHTALASTSTHPLRDLLHPERLATAAALSFAQDPSLGELRALLLPSSTQTPTSTVDTGVSQGSAASDG